LAPTVQREQCVARRVLARLGVMSTFAPKWKLGALSAVAVIGTLVYAGSQLAAPRARSEHGSSRTLQASVGDGKSRSLMHLHDYRKQNMAFIIVKDHAATPAGLRLVHNRLKQARITVLRRGKVHASTIEENNIVANSNYEFWWRNDDDPDDNWLPAAGAAAFEEVFGEDWDDLLDSDSKSLADLASDEGVDIVELSKEWYDLKEGVNKVRISHGYEIGKMRGKYVVNGYWAAIKDQFEKPGTRVFFFEVMWKPVHLSYENFLTHVIGSSAPAFSHPDSIRHHMFHEWENLSFTSQPDEFHNGIIASENMLEAAMDADAWLGPMVAGSMSHPLWKELDARGVDPFDMPDIAEEDSLGYESLNMPLFDIIHGLDRKALLEKLVSIYGWWID